MGGHDYDRSQLIFPIGLILYIIIKLVKESSTDSGHKRNYI